MLQREVQHFPDERQDAIGHDWRGPLRDAVDQRPDLTPREFADFPVSPAWQQLSVDDALVFAPGLFSRLAVGARGLRVRLQLFDGELGERRRRTRGRLLGGWILAGRHSLKGGMSAPTSVCQ